MKTIRDNRYSRRCGLFNHGYFEYRAVEPRQKRPVFWSKVFKCFCYPCKFLRRKVSSLKKKQPQAVCDDFSMSHGKMSV